MKLHRIKGSVAGGLLVVGLTVASVAYACASTRNFFVAPDAGVGGHVVATGFFDCGPVGSGTAVEPCPATGTVTNGLLRSKTPVVIGYQYDLCGIAVVAAPSVNPVYAADGCKPVNGNSPGTDDPIIPMSASGDPGEPCPNKLGATYDDNVCTHLATYILRHSSAQECGPAATSTPIGHVRYAAHDLNPTWDGEGTVAGAGIIPISSSAGGALPPGAYEVCIGLTGTKGITPEDSASIWAASATGYNLYGYYVLF